MVDIPVWLLTGGRYLLQIPVSAPFCLCQMYVGEKARGDENAGFESALSSLKMELELSPNGTLRAELLGAVNESVVALDLLEFLSHFAV